MNPSDNPSSNLPIDPTTFAFRLMNRPVNRVEGFEHGAHARAYLRRCSEQTGLWLEAPERDEPTLAAMKAAGYSSWDKFTRHLRAWHGPCETHPTRLRQFSSASGSQSFSPWSNWTARTMSGPWPPLPPCTTGPCGEWPGCTKSAYFPADCQSELDCVVYVGDACAHHGLRACIHIRSVKTLWLEPPDGHVHVTLYTPSVKITRAQFVLRRRRAGPGHDASGIDPSVSTLCNSNTWAEMRAVQIPASPRSITSTPTMPTTSSTASSSRTGYRPSEL